MVSMIAVLCQSIKMLRKHTIVGKITRKHTIVGKITRKHTIVGKITGKHTIVGKITRKHTIVGKITRKHTIVGKITFFRVTVEAAVSTESWVSPAAFIASVLWSVMTTFCQQSVPHNDIIVTITSRNF